MYGEEFLCSWKNGRCQGIVFFQAWKSNGNVYSLYAFIVMVDGLIGHIYAVITVKSIYNVTQDFHCK